jgi:hypothetical protein
VPSDVTVHCSQEGIKNGGKRSKQRLQGTMTICDDDPDWETSGFGVTCILTNVRSGKRPVRPPTNHF